ncbi:MAG: RsmG family class I SAM-dependent methyltransferase [Ilumatobacteraceae bacterium]
MQSTAEPPIDHQGLLKVLGEAQRIGTLGSAPIPDTIRHSAWFADALPSDVERVIDLGSGAGVPGLIVALCRPTIHMTLVDRRTKCADALLRAVHVLGLGERVRVRCADAADLNQLPDWEHSFDAAISRGFGPPLVTLAISAPFVRIGGTVIISEPPDDRPDRWAGVELAEHGLSGPQRLGPVAVFHVEQHSPGAQ